jgi:hypothetical protein
MSNSWYMREAPRPTPPLPRHPTTDDVLDVLPVSQPRRAAAIAFPPEDGLDVLPLPEITVPLDDVVPVVGLADVPRQRLTLWRLVCWIAYGIASAVEWVFGVVSLIGGLAVLAAVPGLNFLSLGYLLEAGGRIARTGRLRDGFIGVRRAARVGGIVLGVWLLLVPVRLLSSFALSAQIIAPNDLLARRLRVGLVALTVLVVLHVVVALSRGGKLRYFFWPFNPIWLVRRLWRGGYFAEARDGVWDFLVSLRLPYYFWLGFRGFVGTFLWLVLPVSLMALGSLIGLRGTQAAAGAGFVIGAIGTCQLMFVVLLLPFLQMRFAAENRFRALFDWGIVVGDFFRAPWCFAVAFFITVLFSLPLYLLKIEMVPREVAWLPGLFFIVFIYPSRLLAGWAYGHARRRAKPRNPFFWLTGPLLVVPALLFYVLFVYLSQFTSWNGIKSLYEQHAFLLPIPFVGM